MASRTCCCNSLRGSLKTIFVWNSDMLRLKPPSRVYLLVDSRVQIPIRLDWIHLSSVKFIILSSNTSFFAAEIPNVCGCKVRISLGWIPMFAGYIPIFSCFHPHFRATKAIGLPGWRQCNMVIVDEVHERDLLTAAWLFQQQICFCSRQNGDVTHKNSCRLNMTKNNNSYI